MRDLVTKATHIAPADVPVLITGPNGSGKEKLAEIIQANSSVRSGPFVKVNVGALPKELMEAELFGAEAGAYTGATQGAAGRFEAADGGTLFLDEIGNLSLEGQAKLLRVLQTGEFERLGSSTTRRVKVRVISATNTRSAGRDRRRAFPRGPLLPPQRDRAEGAAARRAQGGHPAARAAFPRRRARQLGVRAQRALLAHPLAGQRARADEHDPARVAAVDRRRRSRPAISACRRSPAPTGNRARARARSRRNRRRAGPSPRRHRARGRAELGLSRQALYRRMEKLGLKE